MSHLELLKLRQVSHTTFGASKNMKFRPSQNSTKFNVVARFRETISTVKSVSRVVYVTVFNGLNFSKWSEQVNFHLGASDLDLALLEDKLAGITDSINEAQKSYHKAWERSNRLCLSFMRMIIANNIKTTIPQT